MPFVLMLLQQSAPAPQSTPIDPDWLLSSTVQSAAVLVAIVGGFLVSRLVTLSSERGALIRRLHHRDELRKIKKSEYDEVHAQRVGVSRDWFLDHHKDGLLAARGNVDVDSLLDWIPRGSSDEEMRPFAVQLATTIKNAFSEIENEFPNGIPPQTSSELRSAGVKIPEEAETIYENVAEYIEKQRPQQRDTFASSHIVKPYIPTSSIVYERQDARISREKDLDREICTLDKEISLLSEELSEFGKPDGIRASISVLLYLTLVGIALPTILMALRPVPDGPLSRALVVAAFISGLGVLIGYLLLRVRSLKPPRQQ